MKQLAQKADRYPSESSNEKVKWIAAPIGLRELNRAVGVTISRTSFYRWLESGMLPARKIGYRYFVAVEDLDHFAKESFNL